MNQDNKASGSALADLGSRLGQMNPSDIRNLMMATSVVAPMFAGPIESALGAALPAAQGEQQLSSLQQMYNDSGVDKGGLGGLLSQIGGSLFGGVLDPQAHAYLQARASTANAIANATGQDPNAVMAGLPDFKYTPKAAQAAFGNVQAPLGNQFSGGVLSGLPAASANVNALPPMGGAY